MVWLTLVKMRLKMKKVSDRYDTNKPKPRHGHGYTKYKVSVWWWFYALSNTLATFEVQLMKKLTNTETKINKSIAFLKKACKWKEN